MRALRYDRYGGPSRLRIVEAPIPVPAAGQVLVRVAASSVNSWDWDLLRGTLLARFGGPWRPEHPVLGADVSGEVVAVGAGVAEFAVGDAVWADLSDAGWGCFAEFVAADAAALRRRPAGVDPVTAAAVPQAGGLAWQALVGVAGLAAGEHVLVVGAGGGAGTFAVQLARHLGAGEVVGVDRAEKLGPVRELGATEMITADAGAALFAARSAPGSPRFDVIVDLVARHPLAAYRRLLRPGGRLVVVGGSLRTIAAVAATQGRPDGDGRELRLLAAQPNGGLDELGGLVASAALTPVVDAVVGLEGVAGALARIGAGAVVGKVVVVP
ncbi:NAD(P)-dependent alcohol dehydrogenase [Agromyces marinus]|uniref:NADPH:quinone reductase n=1 Tax=Agromyces marinus TaxID=1389020 RepID=A0ABM8GYD1_9MICO|nr:NAD(P)-dependent alcohol dehydrogenase [Agromyces marinus]UIP58254.1 L-threonine 3-dehydrogenase [Agromyces marinus]BDZ53500.1 NADPH:quinone reductase [Agromyces marinus]